jgi:hypothetical protein
MSSFDTCKESLFRLHGVYDIVTTYENDGVSSFTTLFQKIKLLFSAASDYEKSFVDIHQNKIKRLEYVGHEIRDILTVMSDNSDEEHPKNKLYDHDIRWPSYWMDVMYTADYWIKYLLRHVVSPLLLLICLKKRKQ